MTEYITKEQALYIASYAANTGNLEKVQKLLDAAPTADVVEVDAEKVVYCKDCKHSKILGISRLGGHHESVSYGCDLLQCNVGEDFYCAEGERRGKAK